MKISLMVATEATEKLNITYYDFIQHLKIGVLVDVYCDGSWMIAVILNIHRDDMLVPRFLKVFIDCLFIVW